MGRDLRQYAKQTNVRLVVGFILLLFIIGDGLILIFIGKGAALMGLVCLAGVAVPLLLIVFALWLIDWIVKRNNRET
jgi:membrane protein implicated in regulation of membrane protease activity